MILIVSLIVLRLYEVCPYFDNFFLRVFVSEDYCFFVPFGYTYEDIQYIIDEHNRNKRKIRLYKQKPCLKNEVFDLIYKYDSK